MIYILTQISWLPLKDLFINRKLKLDITQNDIEIFFTTIGLTQPQFALSNQTALLQPHCS